ncbi:hypothetical protein GCM10027514_33770 [Azotobacter armeniacus]
MGTEAAKAIYKERAATAECVNMAPGGHRRAKPKIKNFTASESEPATGGVIRRQIIAI